MLLSTGWLEPLLGGEVGNLEEVQVGMLEEVEMAGVGVGAVEAATKAKQYESDTGSLIKA